MVARRELQFTPDLLRPKRVIPEIVAEQEANSMGKVPSASGIPSPHQSERVLEMRDRVPDAVIQKQRRQRERRFQAKGIEALVVITVSTAFSVVAVMALARLIPYQTAQRERLDEITAEVQAVEHRVESLRRRFPEMFNAGKSKDALIRQYGFVKPNQIPIKILDSTSPRPQPGNN
jgi:cell division protein FtsB